MAEDREKHYLPHDPVLLSPRNEAVTDGARVVFEWEPSEGATEYYLEVATDSTFGSLIISETVVGQTRYEAPKGFPPDEETYFWRVIARSPQGESPGETVESFISASPELAATHLDRPDDDRGLGPYGQLVRSGGVEIAAEVTGRQKYFDEEARMGVEHEGVETGQIAILAGTVIIILVGLIVSVFLLYDNLQRTQRFLVTGISGYPELRELREEADEKLGRYGVVDEQGGVYQIPIERAMQLEILESRARAGAQYSSELPLLPDQLTSADTASAPVQDTTAASADTAAVAAQP